MPRMYKIPCCWQMYGYAYVEADNLSGAIDKVEDAATSLPKNSSYEKWLGKPYGRVGVVIEESFEVDYDVVEDMNKEELPM